MNETTQTLVGFSKDRKDIVYVKGIRGKTYPAKLNRGVATTNARKGLDMGWDVSAVVVWYDSSPFVTALQTKAPVKISKEEMAEQEELYLLGGDY